ncbi:MAG TPA: hypothetical protein VIN40_09685 [Candidatus Tyrphobacter sp.]
MLLLAALLVAGSPSPTPTPDPCAGLLNQLNRPTIGYSTCAVKSGTAVFEFGYQHEQQGTAPHAISQVQVPQGFLRFGILPRFEFDFIGPNIERQASANGFADAGIGFKYELPPSARLTFAIDGLYTPPSGAAAFTAGNASYTLNLDAAYQLTPATSLASTLAFTSTGGFSVTGIHARYGTFTPSVLVLEQLGSVTQAYVEYVDVSRVSPDVGDRAFMDAGVQRLISQYLEIDVEYGHALTADAALRFNYVGAGIGILIR